MTTLFIVFGLKASELKLAESVIEENKTIIIRKWKEHFK
jgi:hypothetical protein